MEKLKANKKILIIAVVALVVIVAGVVIGVSTTGDKKEKEPTKVELNQGNTSSDSGKDEDKKDDAGKKNEAGTGGLQVIDPTKEDVQDEGVDVSELFGDKDNKGDKDSKGDKDTKDDKDDKDNKANTEEDWGEFY